MNYINSFTTKEVVSHNDRLEAYVDEKAAFARRNPSKEEQKMMAFLEGENIRYLFKRPSYTKLGNGMINQYFILDFFIPEYKAVLMLGRKHFMEEDLSVKRMLGPLKKRNPYMRIFHWTTGDLESDLTKSFILKVITDEE